MYIFLLDFDFLLHVFLSVRVDLILYSVILSKRTRISSLIVMRREECHYVNDNKELAGSIEIQVI